MRLPRCHVGYLLRELPTLRAYTLVSLDFGTWGPTPRPASWAWQISLRSRIRRSHADKLCRDLETLAVAVRRKGSEIFTRHLLFDLR